MRHFRSMSVLIVICFLLALCAFIPSGLHKITFFKPDGWPKPVYNFAKNPLTEEGFQLGRKLFYDPILSRDSTISCSSCHLQATGFTHVDHALSHGIDERFGTRNSPALMNLAWSKTFMWDGGVNHLEVQAVAPITNILEMDETMAHVVEKLNASSNYKKLFSMAFGDSIITGQKLLLAIAQFAVQLTSYQSKYDRFMRHEAGGELSEQEKNGLALFRKNCASCHKEPLFTTGNFENNGLSQDYFLKDIGRMKITGKAADSLKFKVPTLRNIQFTQPYMHDGRFKKLADVLNHYTSGIKQSPTLSKQLNEPIQLTPNEKIDIIAFLYTLTDKEFLFDPRFSFPREGMK